MADNTKSDDIEDKNYKSRPQSQMSASRHGRSNHLNVSDSKKRPRLLTAKLPKAFSVEKNSPSKINKSSGRKSDSQNESVQSQNSNGNNSANKVQLFPVDKKTIYPSIASLQSSHQEWHKNTNLRGSIRNEYKPIIMSERKEPPKESYLQGKIKSKINMTKAMNTGGASTIANLNTKGKTHESFFYSNPSTVNFNNNFSKKFHQNPVTKHEGCNSLKEINECNLQEEDQLMNFNNARLIVETPRKLLDPIADRLIIDQVEKNYNRKYSDQTSQLYPIKDKREDEFNSDPLHADRKLNMSIKLEEGVTINIIHSSDSSKIKKFFHLPTFKIYIIKETRLDITRNLNNLISSREDSSNCNWNNNQSCIRIYDRILNNPEGCISTIEEFMSGYSLSNIIEKFQCLNEYTIQIIVKQILTCTTEFKQANGHELKHLCPCMIYFDKKGNIKLKLKDSLSPQICKCIKKFEFLESLLETFNVKNLQIAYVGILLLSICLENFPFQIFNSKFLSNKHLERYRNETDCCALHMLLNIERKHFEISKITPKITIYRFLSKNYSKQLVDFMFYCFCCKKSNSDEWLDMSIKHGVSIHDLIKIQRDTNRMNTSNMQSKSRIKKILGYIKLIYNNILAQSDNDRNLKSTILAKSQLALIKDLDSESKKKVLKEIAYDLNISKQDLIKELKEILK